MSALDTLIKYADKQGWTDGTCLRVACDYIDSMRTQPFEKFVENIACMEAEECGECGQGPDGHQSREHKDSCSLHPANEVTSGEVTDPEA